jgi:hypothetical protein
VLEHTDRSLKESEMTTATALERKNTTSMSPSDSSTGSQLSDMREVRAAMIAREAESVQVRLDQLCRVYSFMIKGCVEWACRWPALSAEVLGVQRAHSVCSAARTAWRTDYKHATEESPDALMEVIESRPDNSPARDLPAEIEAAFSRLWHGPEARFNELCRRVANREFEAALQDFDVWAAKIRGHHDALIRLIWCYVNAVNQFCGQAQSVALLKLTFQSCTFHEPMWKIFESLSPADLAKFLAEHMRTHFSGSNRNGEVEIKEEKDCFRLIFEPCGSGGVIRRELPKDQLQPALFQDAAAETWGRAGEVPAYCAHCALNELASIQRLGFPAWVTEFHRDPNKPCGWTVYKEPRLIPSRYFKRLGIEKPCKS